MAKIKSKFICQQCASEQPRWMGKCPECNAWNSLVEEAEPVAAPTSKLAASQSLIAGRAVAPRRLKDVALEAEERFSTGMDELDRVLGGGVVPGSLVLLGGEPGAGKCVTGDTRVLDPISGDWLPITAWKDHLRPVMSLETSSYRLKPAEVSRFLEQGVRPIVELRTRLGRTFRCTPSHPVFTPEGWKAVEELKHGDRLAAPRALPVFGQEAMADHEVALIAYLLSDGSTQGCIGVTTILPEVVEDLERIAGAFGVSLTRYAKSTTAACTYRFVTPRGERQPFRDRFSAQLKACKSESGLSWMEWARRAEVDPGLLNAWRRGECVPNADALGRLAAVMGIGADELGGAERDQAAALTPVLELVNRLGLRNLHASQKKVPDPVFRLPKTMMARFLRVLFTCDGSVFISKDHSPCLSYSTISRRLAEDIQHLLLRFGFVFRLRTKHQLVRDSPYESYELVMSGVLEVQRFLEVIGLAGRQDAKLRISMLEPPVLTSTHRDTIPTGTAFWAALREATDGRGFAEISASAGVTLANRRHEAPLARRTLERLASTFPNPHLERLAFGEIYWDSIESVTAAGEEMVYDLSVPGPANFIAQDLVVHNSTLLLQVAQHLASQSRRVLYVSGEESARQIRMRSKRLGADHDQLFVLAETDLQVIAATIAEHQPEWAVIDSIQAIYDPSLSSAPGSVSQVRGATGTLMRIAKDQGVSICLVGHVTKEGTLAGPRVLEHMVDTVLYFEGDRFKSYRLVRSVKNRFGATHEVGLFEMMESGLAEVTNPSALFLAERTQDTSGSAVVATMEGTRPLLVEIQALISPSTLSSPRRTATGIEHNRMVQILAVLEKRVGLPLSKYDAYVNVVGGLTIDEPAGDLGVALAVASSMRDVALDPQAIALGEVGLNGEVRGISQLEARLKEAAKLGFTRAIVPAHNLDDRGLRLPAGIEVVGVTRLYDALVKATLGPIEPQ